MNLHGKTAGRFIDEAAFSTASIVPIKEWAMPCRLFAILAFSSRLLNRS